MLKLMLYANTERIYSYFEGIPTEYYIEPQNYERSKTKKYKSNMALRENMACDAELNEYTCQAGRKLRASYTGIQQNRTETQLFKKDSA